MALLYLAVVGSVLAFGFFFYLIKRVRLTTVASMTLPDREAFNLVAIHHQDIVLFEGGVGLFAGNGFVGLALGRVVFDEVGEVIRRDEVVHGHDFDFLAEKALVTDSAEDEAANAPKAVDADFNHNR